MLAKTNAPKKSMHISAIEVCHVEKTPNGSKVTNQERKYFFPLNEEVGFIVREPRGRRGKPIGLLPSLYVRSFTEEDLRRRFHFFARAYLKLRERYPYAASVAKENFVIIQAEAGRRGIFLHEKGFFKSWVAGAVSWIIGKIDSWSDEPCDEYAFFIAYY